MIRNYLKIAIRTIWRNKAFSIINILGLSIGIATCILILLFIRHEISYDRYNENAGRIVRVTFGGVVQGEKMQEANVMPPVAKTLKADFPEVVDATRLNHKQVERMSYGNKTFRNEPLAFVDDNFFRIFTIPLLKGSSQSVLSEPNTVVISAAAAKKYFGTEDPIGKILELKNQQVSLKVTGLFDKIPDNSHFHFDFFASMNGLDEAKSDSWMNSGYYTYLLLPENFDYKKLQAKLPAAFDKYVGPQFQQALGMDIQQYRKSGNNIELNLQPLTDIHLHSDFTGDLSAPGDSRYIYIFGAIALFMLLIACINFMNLSTAGASRRAREVGIRKVMGSLKKQLVLQFLVESVLLASLSTLLAIVFVQLGLPVFNYLAGKQLSFTVSGIPWLVPGMVVIALITGLLAGSYPAFFLSSFRPVKVLKGKFSIGRGTLSLRSGLVVFQFCISMLLIVGTIVVYRQLSFIQEKKLGYDKDQVLIVEQMHWLGKNESAFRQQVLTDPRVAGVTSSNFLPAGNSYGNNFFVTPDNHKEQFVKTLLYEVDENYIPTMGMEIIKGRNFSREFGTDSFAVIINEAAARAFGWEKDELAHSISHSYSPGEKTNFQVVGMVKDFHFRSLHERISPLVMLLTRDGGDLIIKLKGKDMAGMISSLKSTWDSYRTDAPLTYSFLDDRFNNTYREEQRTGTILLAFASLTIFVACMGLFGLATFMAEQRSREIGIRKVLGASVTGITGLLSKEFLKLILLAFLIATPISWFIMNRWLEDFAYRTSISASIYFLTALLIGFLTLVTISFRSIRAALANPIDSLRAD